MNENIVIQVEIVFNLFYLVAIWGIVIALFRRRGRLTGSRRRLAELFAIAFAFLALGDTAHVGFRVWAYALGGLESEITLAGRTISLVGAGAAATAVTVTVFYIVMVEIWRFRYNRRYGLFEYLLLIVGATRIFMLTFAINEWWRVVPRQPWSTIRNIPLMILGLGVAFLILRDAAANQDRTFQWIGISILVSFGFYLPVILWVQQAPMLGMLMIPKTLAYLVIGLLAILELKKERFTDPLIKPRRSTA